MADKASYLSRFAMKFVEIVAAGIATAVSGYLVAHFGGFLTSPVPAPAAVQIAPSAAVAPKGALDSVRAQPARPVAADANAQRLAPAPVQDAGPPAVQPVRTIVNAAPAPARKHAKAEVSVPESTPRDAESKREEESVEAQVRAALANVDANRPAPPEAPPQRLDHPPQPAAVETQPRPADASLATASVPAMPRAADPAPTPQAPLQPDPLASVEIKSRPVADISVAPAGQAEDKGLLSTIKKIPDMLRPGAAAATGEPPRPPMPVGD